MPPSSVAASKKTTQNAFSMFQNKDKEAGGTGK
jgi:hypothetical protein